MKAPTDKRNPYIQYCVTRACNLRCSNCTQLLSLRGQKHVPVGYDPIHMSPACFDRALELTDDWPRKHSIFGGNPATHPKFPELMESLVRRVPNQAQRAIFCNDPMGHADLIRDVFAPHGDINFNVHYDSEAAEKIRAAGMGRYIVGHSDDRSSWHTPILIDYRDQGLSESEWVAKRENCQFNHEWSAAVMDHFGEPFVYFCEIAGAIDAMTGDTNGLRLERGWWRWKMDRFVSQVGGCCDKGCGVPLKLLGSRDADEALDYSAKWLPIIEGRRGMEARPAATSGPTTKSVTDYLGLRTEKPTS